MNNQDFKESNQDWIREIPFNWELKKIKELFIERNERVDDVSFPPLSVTMGGVIEQMENVSKSDDNENRKMVLKDDFVINSRSDRKGSSGISPRDGSVSLINNVLKPKNINLNFSEYLFKSYYFKEEYFRNGKGIHLDLWSTKYDLMKQIVIPYPNLKEQQQIVSYLDKKTQKIDELVKKTEKKIELLTEQKNSLINEVVTKGLNPDVEMKDSGVEWIDEIPSHWEIKKLKYIVDDNVESLSGSTNPNLELRYIEISDVDSDGNISTPTEYLYSESPSRCRRVCHEGNVIISTVRTYLKSIGLIEREEKNLICSTGFSVLKPKKGFNSKYIFYLLRSNWFLSKVVSKSEGVSYPSIQSHKLLGTEVISIDMDEQESIVEFLDNKTEKINEVISYEEKRTDLLKEYKQSLISEVVTGKKRVTEDMV